jgi:hypothetical protein
MSTLQNNLVSHFHNDLTQKTVVGFPAMAKEINNDNLTNFSFMKSNSEGGSGSSSLWLGSYETSPLSSQGPSSPKDESSSNVSSLMRFDSIASYNDGWSTWEDDFDSGKQLNV